MAVRPSGTEPKCKFYISASRPIPEDAGDAAQEEVKRRTDALALALRDDILRKATEGI